ncbi:hypothetical protein EPA93_44490 [Ktedonosporobacter rubrisoli]|uniref:Uncharacterized protein n=1 Tax=Ktedonosporobacter rubrisoli TaxID=2509675 RepID=A0A4P6K3D3_KTERU|nr:hypothetical protein [Ktedonosporobacter rubrisoli]QBD82654.1 hypothetical protein EPA93_44490 [Ktedonosporobacter rubrisoli]
MCLSCGCGRPDDDHKDRRNITLQDIDAAAQAAGTTRAKVLSNIVSGVQQSEQDADLNQQLRDGYRETEGDSYGQSHNMSAPEPGAIPAQRGYDPAHSGVRHARNRPGERIDNPGRETGTAWGEDQQMGYTTDTSDRRNPAG